MMKRKYTKNKNNKKAENSKDNQKFSKKKIE
jgi:hypothetical protein